MTEGRLLSAEELENALAMVVCVDDRAALVALGDIRAHIAALSRPAKDVEGLVAELNHEARDTENHYKTRERCAEAAAALTALARENGDLKGDLQRRHKDACDRWEVIAELVRIKARKDAEGPYTGYDREKNAAWAAAHACLSRAVGDGE